MPTLPAAGCVDFETLSSLYGFERPADVRRVLDRDRIRYFMGKEGRVWTTLELIHRAAGVAGNDESAPMNPDDFRSSR